MSLEEGSSTHKRESPRLIEPHSISELAATLEDIFAKRASETDVKESRYLQARIKRLHSVMEVLPEKTAELGAAIEKVTKESACGPVAVWLVGGWSKNKPFKSSSDFDLIVTTENTVSDSEVTTLLSCRSGIDRWVSKYALSDVVDVGLGTLFEDIVDPRKVSPAIKLWPL